MIPQNEITALLSVIERLEQTQRLTPLQIFRKEQARTYRFSPDGRDHDVHAHQRKYGKKSVFQPREKNHPVYGDTHFALGFQARYLDAELSDWFSWAHVTILPGIAARIKAILKRAKMSELSERFVAAYDKHFSDLLKPAIQRKPSGDQKLDWLQSDVPRLDVTLKSIDRSTAGSFSFAFEFCCHDSGGFVIEAPDDEDANGPALCKACGQVFGKMGQVRALAQLIGQLELKKRGLASP